MANYRYLAHDLRTGAFLGELPLGNVTYTDELNGAGSLSGAILDLGARTSDGTRLAPTYLNATTPRRTAVWVERNGALVPASPYLIWRRQHRRSSRVLQLQMQSMLSFLARTDPLTTTLAVDDDQLDIVRTLVAHAQSKPGGDVGIEVGAETSGVTRTGTWWSYERRNIGKLIEDLAAQSDGFDFSVDASYVDDVPTATLRLWYPRKGRRLTGNDIVFQDGKNLLDWTLDEDGAGAASTVHALGPGNGDDMMITTISRTDVIDAGYPLTSIVKPMKDAATREILQSRARVIVDDVADTPTTWAIQVDPNDPDIPFGAWTVGDDCRLRVVDDDRFPAGVDGSPGLDIARRITAQSVTVNDSGGETVWLTTGPIHDAR